MAQPLIAGLPPFLQLGAGFGIRLQALDSTTGNVVTGVKVSNVTIFVQNVGGGPATKLESGPFLLVSGPDG